VSRVDTGLVTQCYTVAGMAFPGESVEQRRGVIPRRVKVVVRVLWCQSIKCAYTGAGAGTTRACRSPRARWTSPEGAFSPRVRRTSPEGTLGSRARQTPLEGAFAHERGGPRPRGHQAVPPWRTAGAARVMTVLYACCKLISLRLAFLMSF
jgi:hypothetical protein